MAVRGGGDQSLFPSYRDRGMVDEQLHFQAPGHGCIDHGNLAMQTFSRPYLSF